MLYEDVFSEVMMQVRSLHPEDLMCLNNAIADDTYFDTMYIFENRDETIDEVLCGKTPMEILRTAEAGSYSVGHKFARFNGYGNLISSDYVTDLSFDFELMTDWLIKNPDKAPEFGIEIPLDEEDEE